MRTTTTNLSIQMNVETKKEAEAMFDSLGMSLTTAINIFIKQSLRTRGIPFQITMDTPNAVTLAAMEEARQLGDTFKRQKMMYNYSSLFCKVK